MSWRDWLPWPFGSHWCWQETFQVGLFAVFLSMSGTAMFVAGLLNFQVSHRWEAVVGGALFLLVGWRLGRVVKRNWRRNDGW